MGKRSEAMTISDIICKAMYQMLRGHTMWIQTLIELQVQLTIFTLPQSVYSAKQKTSLEKKLSVFWLVFNEPICQIHLFSSAITVFWLVFNEPICQIHLFSSAITLFKQLFLRLNASQLQRSQPTRPYRE
jgi:hypothetical protein